MMETRLLVRGMHTENVSISSNVSLQSLLNMLKTVTFTVLLACVLSYTIRVTLVSTATREGYNKVSSLCIRVTVGSKLYLLEVGAKDFLTGDCLAAFFFFTFF